MKRMMPLLHHFSRLARPALRLPLVVLASIILFAGCGEEGPVTIEVNSLFTALPSAYTGIDFSNNLANETNFNVFKYRNYYNGGGVAIGDLNGDGLADVYLVGNHEINRLYLNEGKMQFRDVTSSAEVGGGHAWSTGAAIVDMNADGRLDLYVSNSGNVDGDNRANELFINEGNNSSGVPQFREAAKEYGIDDRGFSTHAAFFDYDRDGDLDLYVLNNAFRPLSTFDLSRNLRFTPDPHGGGDQFYRNDNGVFSNITAEAGVLSSVIAFGLGVSVSDVNNDGWLDVYIANDFFERDYLYINQQNGTFSEQLEEMIPHVSLSSMGADIADLNNDGFMEIYTTDMLPEDDRRLKTTFTFDTFDFVEQQVKWGYGHQVSQNVLQLNNGPGPDGRFTFSDIALYAGVAKSDWSWAATIFDLDNDGLKDIFISNGIFRDVTDQDYLELLMNNEHIQQIMQGEKVDFPELIRQMPSTPLRNYAFRNNGDLTFSNLGDAWGLDTLSFSNGVAYGDLDLDGDIDMVVNNVNSEAFVYRNESNDQLGNHFLQVQLIGEGANRFAIGAKATIRFEDGSQQVLEHMPMRGFQSSMDYTLTFGFGKASVAAADLRIDWPDGRVSNVQPVPLDTLLTLKQAHAARPELEKPASVPSLLKEITAELGFEYLHQENDFDDFRREPLLPEKLSTEGPRIAVGDVNGDGRVDLYVGGAKATAGKILIHTANGFDESNQPVFEKHKISEDVDAAFFDADGDRDLDLYVVSGGNEYSRRAPALVDRLYLNDGRGNFSYAQKALPHFQASGSCVALSDFDGDGDIDLFVGSRSIPWRYGLPPVSYLLQNDGRGKFSVVTDEVAPGLKEIGMITDAQWADQDGNGRPDLILAGDWMPLTIFHNKNGKLINGADALGLAEDRGLWNRILATDLDQDGHLDLIAGNLGRNAKITPHTSFPITMHVGDFNRNGMVEQLLTVDRQGTAYPLPLLSALSRPMPGVRQLFPSHADYAEKQVSDILNPGQLESARILEVTRVESVIYYGRADGKFDVVALPALAQLFPIRAIHVEDLDNDGRKDIILGGNFYSATVQLGRYDAGYGLVLKGQEARHFKALTARESGLQLSGEIRDIGAVPSGKQKLLLFARNNDTAVVYQVY